jgi:chromosome partitioning protein
MKIVAIVSQKGGSGKTTLTAHLAVCAELRDQPTLIIDLDPQASAVKWHRRRHDETPEVLAAEPTQLASLMHKAKAGGAGLVLVDTAPHSDKSAAVAIQLADLVLIPCRPTALDVDAIGSTLDIVKLSHTKAAVVLNAIPTRGPQGEEVRAGLEPLVSVAPVGLYHRAAYFNAMNDGRSVEEYEPKGKAAKEIQALYQWVIKQ